MMMMMAIRTERPGLAEIYLRCAMRDMMIAIGTLRAG
jgi:hypothetical protein